MSVRFSPCSACARHVKEGDRVCPFCGAEVSRSIEVSFVPRGRLSRAALFAAGAASALAAADCSSSSAYGGPPVSEGNDAASEGGFAQPLYGAVVPPLEAGAPQDDASGDATAGGGPEGGVAQPLYGAVAPPYGLTPLDPLVGGRK
jgi:hypothetical protein